MIREFKITFKPVSANYCEILYEARDDNYGAWEKQGTIHAYGALEQVRQSRIALQERWGWIPYDTEEENVLTFWKEF